MYSGPKQGTFSKDWGRRENMGSEIVVGSSIIPYFHRDYLHNIIFINSSRICILLFEPILKCELKSVIRRNVRSLEIIYLCTDLSD